MFNFVQWDTGTRLVLERSNVANRVFLNSLLLTLTLWKLSKLLVLLCVFDSLYVFA